MKMNKKFLGAVLSAVLASAMGLSAFAATSSTTSTTAIVATGATEQQKQSAAAAVLSNPVAQAAVATVPKANDGSVDLNAAVTAENVGTTSGVTFYGLNSANQVTEVDQSTVTYAATKNDNGSYSFNTVDAATGKLITPVVENGSVGYAVNYSAEAVYKLIGSDLGVSEAAFLAAPEKYVAYREVNGQKVRVNLFRWVVVNGKKVLAVNYKAFGTEVKFEYDATATVQSAADAVAADVTVTNIKSADLL